MSVYQGESAFKLIPIWFLSDDLMSKIFSYLDPNERFRLAEVCTRWAGVSRTSWTDIASIALSPIPNENMGPIIRLCPKLVSITAQDCEMNVTSITENLRSELKFLHLYRVSAHADFVSSPEDPQDGAPNVFLRELQQLTHLEELVLSELPENTFGGWRNFVWDNLPSSLKRLQLNVPVFCSQSESREGLEESFGMVDCLILREELLWPLCASKYAEITVVVRRTILALLRLRQLRELSLDTLLSNVIAALGERQFVCAFLDQLEVLSIQIGISHANVLSGIVPLLSSHPTLRILIITGATTADAGELLIPPRRRYPNGLGSDPLPLLHVFIGGQIAEKIRFARAPNDALEVHPITLPMPAFLEQPEVAAIFKGSWIGEMIMKGAKANSRLWDYDARLAQSVLVLNP